jgi:prepilin-type N-terminal cleavage/methylation domain-containing protein
MGFLDRRQLDARGFTLLELIVTVFVVALAVGLVAPVVGRSTETLRGRSEIARFSAMLRHAREQAITTRQGHAVVIDPATHRATIVAGRDEVMQTRALPPELGIEARPPEALTVRFEPSGVSTGGDFELRTGRTRYRVTVDALTGRVRAERTE